jgi:hypothetical protein
MIDEMPESQASSAEIGIAEKLAKEREDADRTIIFMNPSSFDDKARVYWEILAREIRGGVGDGV